MKIVVCFIFFLCEHFNLSDCINVTVFTVIVRPSFTIDDHNFFDDDDVMFGRSCGCGGG